MGVSQIETLLHGGSVTGVYVSFKHVRNRGLSLFASVYLSRRQ